MIEERVKTSRAGTASLRRATTLLASSGVAAVLCACSGHAPDPTDAPAPSPHAAPTASGSCNDLPVLHGDPGMVIGTDWSGEHHDYGDTVVVYGCVTVGSGGHASLVAQRAGVRIRPRAVPVDSWPSGVIPFQVTVAEGGSGMLRLQQTGGGLGGDIEGPIVAPDDHGWHLVRHGG